MNDHWLEPKRTSQTSMFKGEHNFWYCRLNMIKESERTLYALFNIIMSQGLAEFYIPKLYLKRSYRIVWFKKEQIQVYPQVSIVLELAESYIYVA